MTVPTAVLRRWGGLLLVGGVVSTGLGLLGLPSPVLFGALAAGMVQALTSSDPVQLPGWSFRLGQALIGVVVGALVSVSTLTRLRTDWPSVVGVIVGTLAISVAVGRLLALRRDVSPTTGVFALVAGGASGIVALSRELGADDRVVTVVQYLRVLLVLLVMPLVTTLVFRPPSVGGGEPATTATRWLPDLVFVAVSVGLGMLTAQVVRVPAAALLGPLLVAVALSASQVLGDVVVPTALEDVGYALVGVQVGLRFTRASLRSIAGMLPVVLGLILTLILASAGMALVLSAATGVDRLTTYLATTPGGLFAVLAIARDSGSDVTYVLTLQVIRVFAMLLGAPLLARLLRRSDRTAA